MLHCHYTTAEGWLDNCQTIVKLLLKSYKCDFLKCDFLKLPAHLDSLENC